MEPGEAEFRFCLLRSKYSRGEYMQNTTATSCPHQDDARLLTESFSYGQLRVLALSEKPLSDLSDLFFPLSNEGRRMLRRCNACRTAFDDELARKVELFRTMGDGQMPCPDMIALIGYAVNPTHLALDTRNRIERHICDASSACKACEAYVQMIQR